MTRQMVYADLPPMAGLFLVLLAIAFTAVMWVVLMAAWRLADALSARRIRAANVFVGRCGAMACVTGGVRGMVMLDPEGGAACALPCRTGRSAVRDGDRVRVIGYDDGSRLHVVEPVVRLP